MGVGGKPSAKAQLQVHRFEITPKMFERIPIQERVLFLSLGHVANELSFLRKLVLISNDDIARRGGKIERDAGGFQTLSLIKLFALKACAGHELLRKQAKQQFMKEYGRDTDSGFAEAVRRMNKYFNGASLLEYVRNKLAAHYDLDLIGELAARSIDRPHHLYVSEHQGNTLYFAAEELMFAALSEHAGAGEVIGDVMGRLIDDVDKIAAMLTDCAQGAMIMIGKRYAKAAWRSGKIETENVPMIDARSLTFPFFVDFRSFASGDEPSA